MSYFESINRLSPQLILLTLSKNNQHLKTDSSKTVQRKYHSWNQQQKTENDKQQQ